MLIELQGLDVRVGRAKFGSLASVLAFCANWNNVGNRVGSIRTVLPHGFVKT